MKREPGYYWVKNGDAWIIAEWISRSFVATVIKAQRSPDFGSLPYRENSSSAEHWEAIGNHFEYDDSDFSEIDEERIVKRFKRDYKKMTEAFEKAIDNITPEDMKKYFPKDTRPKGWLSIEEYLPMMYAADIMQGYSVYKVKDKDGHESHSGVSDHNTWYYEAKEAGITHWWHE